MILKKAQKQTDGYNVSHCDQTMKSIYICAISPHGPALDVLFGYSMSLAAS